MKVFARFGFFTLILAVLFSCSMPGGLKTSSQTPVLASISGSKGLFLSASSGSSGASGLQIARTLARQVVSSSGATLVSISGSGSTETVMFTDSSGGTVTASVTEAYEISSSYVLLSLTWSGGSGTFLTSLSSGSMASIADAPANWSNIAANATDAWWVTGGFIIETALASGAQSTISSSETGEYGSGGSGTSSSAWPNSTWLFVDSSGNLWALYGDQGYLSSSPSSQPILDYVFPVSGSPAFVNVVDLWESLQVSSSPYWLDPSSGTLYGVTVSGDSVGLTPCVFSVASASESSGTTSDFTSAVDWGSGSANLYAIGGGPDDRFFYVLGSSEPGGFELSDSGSGPVLASYNLSSVPSDGDANDVAEPYEWNGGMLYVGPPGTSGGSTIDYVGVVSGLTNGSMATDPAIVTDSNAIASWTVSGGELVYSDATGTYEASATAGATATKVSSTETTVATVTE